MHHSYIGPVLPQDEPNPIPVDRTHPPSRFDPDIRYRCFATAATGADVGRDDDEGDIIPRRRCGPDPLRSFLIPTMPIDCTSAPTCYDEAAQRQHDCFLFILSCGKGGLRSSLRAMRAVRSLNITPSAACYSAILQQCVHETNADVALETYEAMNVLGIPIGVNNFRMILSVLEKTNRHFHAAALLIDSANALDEAATKSILAAMLKAPPTLDNNRWVRAFLHFLEEKGTRVDPHVFFLLIGQHAQRGDSVGGLAILDEHCSAGVEVPDWVITSLIPAVLNDSSVPSAVMLRNGLRLFAMASENGTPLTAEMHTLLMRCAYRAGEPIDALAIFAAARRGKLTTQTMFLDAIRVVLGNPPEILTIVFEEGSRTRITSRLCGDMMVVHPFHSSAPEMLTVLAATHASILRVSLEDRDVATAAWVIRAMVEHERGNVIAAVTSFHTFVATHRDALPKDGGAAAVATLACVGARLLHTILTAALPDGVTPSCLDYLHGFDGPLLDTESSLSRLCPKDTTTLVVLDGTALTALLEGDAATKFVHMMADYYHKGGGFAVVPFTVLMDVITQQKKGVLRLVQQWASHYPWLRLLPLSVTVEAFTSRPLRLINPSAECAQECDVTLALFGAMRGLHKRSVMVVRSLFIEAQAKGVLGLKGVAHLHTLMDRIS